MYELAVAIDLQYCLEPKYEMSLRLLIQGCNYSNIQ